MEQPRLSWDEVTELAGTNPIVRACLSAYKELPREKQLIAMILNLHKDNRRLLKLVLEQLQNNITQIVNPKG